MTNFEKLREATKIKKSIQKSIDQAQRFFDNDVCDYNCAIIDNLRAAMHRCEQKISMLNKEIYK